jgi:hypothetical protein
MQPSRLKPTLRIVVNILTIYWQLTCTSSYEGKAAYSGRGLREIPKNLQKDLIILDLSNNNITTIKTNDFNQLKSVKKINLSYNKIQEIYKGSFEHVGGLEEVNLSYNNIVSLLPNIFSGNKNLIKVHLQKNWLQVTGYLLESTSLTYLDISFCNITSISREAFSGLPNLETLKMNGNSLLQLDVEVIKPLKKLKKMHIEFCNPSTLKNVCFHLRTQVMEFTLSPPCRPTRGEHEWMVHNVAMTGTIMCVCAFIIVVTVYLLTTICKFRKATGVTTEEHDSERIIQQRPLPQPPDLNDGYEVPIKHTNYGWFLSAPSRNRRLKGGSANNRGISTRAVSGTDHLSTQSTPGSVQSVPSEVDYQVSQLYTRQERNEEDKENLLVPLIRECSMQEVPQLPTEYRQSSISNTSAAEGPCGFPLGPFPMTGPSSCGPYSEDHKMSLPPIPPRPTYTCQAQLKRKAPTVCVNSNDSETTFVSSTFIELRQDS